LFVLSPKIRLLSPGARIARLAKPVATLGAVVPGMREIGLRKAKPVARTHLQRYRLLQPVEPALRHCTPMVAAANNNSSLPKPVVNPRQSAPPTRAIRHAARRKVTLRHGYTRHAANG